MEKDHNIANRWMYEISRSPRDKTPDDYNFCPVNQNNVRKYFSLFRS